MFSHVSSHTIIWIDNFGKSPISLTILSYLDRCESVWLLRSRILELEIKTARILKIELFVKIKNQEVWQIVLNKVQQMWRFNYKTTRNLTKICLISFYDIIPFSQKNYFYIVKWKCTFRYNLLRIGVFVLKLEILLKGHKLRSSTSFHKNPFGPVIKDVINREKRVSQCIGFY